MRAVIIVVVYICSVYSACPLGRYSVYERVVIHGPLQVKVCGSLLTRGAGFRRSARVAKRKPTR